MLGMLAREARSVWQAREWLGEGRREDEVSRLLRRPPSAAAAVVALARSMPDGAAAGQPRALLGGRAPAQAGRGGPARAVAPHRGSVRGLMRRWRSGRARAARRARDRRRRRARRRRAAARARPRWRWRCPTARRWPATADSRDARGCRTCSAGGRMRSGSGPRSGVHDPVKARALALDDGRDELVWLAVDLVGIDPASSPSCVERLAPRRATHTPR